MPRVDVLNQTRLADSFRVQQVAGMFDVPLAATLTRRIAVDVPDVAEDWSIGLVAGPSGSGKSSVVRRAFPAAHIWDGLTGSDWPADRALIDGLPGRTLGRITRVLACVGLSSAPTWLRPYGTLSTGERFRAELARAILTLLEGSPATPAGANAGVHGPTVPPAPGAEGEPSGREPTDAELAALEAEEADDDDVEDADAPARGTPARPADARPILVVDEFTSLVDRLTATMASAALAKAIRSGALPIRLVAATCHDDVRPWLTPDWTVDVAESRLTWGCLRRPEIPLELSRTTRRLWPTFRPHHYLSGSLSPAAVCYAAHWEGRPVAFVAVLPAQGRAGGRRVSRLVVRPEFQGLSVGRAVLEELARYHRRQGLSLSITTGHPGLIRGLARSESWSVTGFAPLGFGGPDRRRPRPAGRHTARADAPASPPRTVASLVYVGPDGTGPGGATTGKRPRSC